MAIAVDIERCVPSRSDQQRFDALARANHVRVWRAARKRDLKAGRVSVTGLLRECPAEVETWKVFDLLLATPKYGRVKAMKLLNAARIAPSKTVGGLSDRQRRELLLALGMRVA